MTTIFIPKEKMLELIKNDTCGFYDYTSYNSLDIDIVFDSTTTLKEYDGASRLNLAFKDLSSLLFDRVVKVSNELLITVF
ncbi:MAG TPA: hypothetical protein VLA48_02870 [Nitrososphaeraceae archaeon]|nr:hypothetical protein [Nitrososphaeraceae archaeon]